ncbi:Ferrous iron transport protein B [Candidatus Cyrtobacter comes]|uniref:Ferrous iron transport protein B n=1 Tax=Candidatus Cyrtobacter comes TaxID=675776 RepID=A0ABU5L9Z4_9RICK|nr:ferrous iron transporter B [Candidatus Cyrtobacter comes]MDZ5762715.1 Ferrous iron transport protein B [Candidatus Cyrtobacter comes]
MDITTACIIGQPNSGKSTVFNILTGSMVKTSNWPGSTVEKNLGKIKESGIELIDLPGIYSLDAFARDEKISTSFLEKKNYDLIINVVDVTNLQRNFYLTLQLLDFKKPLLLVINKKDKTNTICINEKKLSELLNCSVIYISARKEKEAKQQLLAELVKVSNKTVVDHPIVQNASVLDKIQERNRIIEQILNLIMYSKTSSKVSEFLDRILLNKFYGSLVLCFVLLGLFSFSINAGGILVDNILYPLRGFWDYIHNKLPEYTIANTVLGGVWLGVETLCSFFPIIFCLYIFISVLEESGYMARLAALTSNLFNFIKLPGKGIIMFIIGFGCNVPAILATRSIQNEWARHKMILLLPFMSCGARLAVFTIISSAIFPSSESYIILILYIIGTLCMILTALLLGFFTNARESIIMEMPDYSIPSARLIIRSAWAHSYQFIIGAGKLIIPLAFVLQIIGHISINFNFTDINNSILAYCSNGLLPIFEPIGTHSWQLVAALIAGTIAKELIPGTLFTIFSMSDGNVFGISALIKQLFSNKYEAFSYLLFVLIYSPCISVFATSKKEAGTMIAFIGIIWSTVLAYLISFIFYKISIQFFLN